MSTGIEFRCPSPYAHLLAKGRGFGPEATFEIACRRCLIDSYKAGRDLKLILVRFDGLGTVIGVNEVPR